MGRKEIQETVLNRSGELAFAADIRPAKDVATTQKCGEHQFAVTLW